MRLLALMLTLGCASTQPREWVAPKPGPVVVALARPNPAVTLTPPGEVNGQLFIAADEAWKLLAVDVQQGPAALTVPYVMRRSGNYLWAAFRICADPRGVPSTVTLLKSADKLVDADWLRAVHRWRFNPVLRDGAPRGFCSDVPVGARVEWDAVRPPGVDPATRSIDL
jgi:hypothetical protein